MIIRKVILFGEIAVGKTSIARQLVFKEFGSVYKATIGVDIFQYTLDPAPTDGPFHFLVWDTDGSYGEQIFRNYYARQAQAALIVGDVERPATIDTMLKLGERYAEAAPGRFFAYVLNKVDLTGGEPPPAIAEQVAATRVPWTAISAKTGKNVEATFRTAAARIIELERGHA